MAPRLVIFDLDNCLYCEPPELGPACNHAIATVACDMVPGLDYNEALKISEMSQKRTGYVRTYFTQNYNLDPLVLHERFHNMVDHLLLPVCEDTKSAFAQIDRDQTALGLLTHGSRGWSERVLDRLGLTEFFDPRMVVPVEDVDFVYKHENEKPFLHLLDRAEKHLGLRVAPTDAMMVEDVPINLAVPHRMGMETVLVHHDKTPEKHAYIGHFCENVTEVIEKFIAKA
jgi:putative hydrolase of the HAD superfamily